MDTIMITKKLRELSKFEMKFNTNEKEVVVTLKYPPEWKVVAPANPDIACGERRGMTYYHALISDTVFDEIFKAIDMTVEVNREMEEKLLVFKEKNEEMIKLFETEDLETLRTLKFAFKRPRNRKNPGKSETAFVETTPAVPSAEETVPTAPDSETEPIPTEAVSDEAESAPYDSSAAGPVEGIVYTPPTEDVVSYDDLLGGIEDV